jgi:hypothetical protein
LHKRSIILLVLLAFALTETGIFIWSSSTGEFSASSTNAQISVSGQNPFLGYSLPLSLGGWSAIALVFFQGRVSRRSQVKKLFLKQGLDSGVYDLMVGMRGGTSRLALLEHMEPPRHRQELSEMTGIDWKEVDRELGLLEKYGLVKMYAQSGTVRMYQVTEQGSLLVKLIEELNAQRHA